MSEVDIPAVPQMPGDPDRGCLNRALGRHAGKHWPACWPPVLHAGRLRDRNNLGRVHDDSTQVTLLCVRHRARRASMAASRSSSWRSSVAVGCFIAVAACGSASVEESGTEDGSTGTETWESGQGTEDPSDLDLPGFVVVRGFQTQRDEVALLGDINGDGLGDLFVASRAAEDEPEPLARTYVVYGKHDEESVDLADVEEGEGGFPVRSLALWGTDSCPLTAGGRAAGDINGDGLGDFMIYSGRPGETRRLLVVAGRHSRTALDVGNPDEDGVVELSAEWGGSVPVGLGDVNDDGRDDFAVSSGRSTYVVFGTDGAFPTVEDIEAGVGGYLIQSYWGLLTGGGDVNADGIPDVAISGD